MADLFGPMADTSLTQHLNRLITVKFNYGIVRWEEWNEHCLALPALYLCKFNYRSGCVVGVV